MRMTAFAAAIFSLTSAAVAASPAVPVPTEYLAAIAPDSVVSSGVEKPGALAGSTYTVVAPIFHGADGNTSYLRLINGGDFDATFTIVIVGSPSGRVYGTTTYTVPRYAAPQYSIDDIRAQANAGGLNGGDTSYALYLRSPLTNAHNSFQHVIYSENSKFFENASACTYSPNVLYDSGNQLLVNVHTSTIAGYPSTIYLHNFYQTPLEYEAIVYDARNGAELGTVNIATAANATYAIPFSWFEEQIGFNPSPSQFHANIRFRTTSFIFENTAVVSQGIVNSTLNAFVNMSLFCSVNPPS